MTAAETTPAAGTSAGEVPHIGAFVLETLTLGMYGEPRHTLREYVQNSFDSIRAAQRLRRLESTGRVTIVLGEDRIAIQDNGLGIPKDQAWKTLTSIGASKKDRQRDAGFRGIGRLAGMAYCEKLVFRTTFAGEPEVSRVTFDCKQLLKAMSPDDGGDVELSKLLAKAIKSEIEAKSVDEDEHFFHVILEGTKDAPKSLTDFEQVKTYLSETAPVSYDPAWPFRQEIEDGYKEYFGELIEAIDLFVKTSDAEAQIFRPYTSDYTHAKGTMQLRDIEFHGGDDSEYWGWVGHLNESAAVTDWSTRGLRVRVRNIQVDGTEIFEKLFTQVKPSYSRFNNYYVGEFHISPKKIVPNARRDGFEETKEWIGIRNDLVSRVCVELAQDAYAASQKGQVDTVKIAEDIEKLAARSTSLVDSSKATYDQVVDVMNTAKRLRRRANSALKTVGDLDELATDEGEPQKRASLALREATRDVENIESQARMLVGKFVGEEDKLAGLRARIREEVIREVLDVVNLYVEPTIYQKIKRQLRVT